MPPWQNTFLHLIGADDVGFQSTVGKPISLGYRKCGKYQLVLVGFYLI